MPFGSGVKMPCCRRGCSVAVPEHSLRPPFWPSPAGTGGGRWVVSRATGTPGLSNFCSILSLKLGCDWNISGSSLSGLFFFCFYFSILSSPAFLEVWWKVEDCTCLGAGLQFLQGGTQSFSSDARKCHSEACFYLVSNKDTRGCALAARRACMLLQI